MSTTTIKFSEAKKAISDILSVNLVPMLAGSPGGGKSALVREIQKEYKLALIDLRLAQCDPVDLLGMPFVDTDTDRAGYMPLETFPLEHTPVPDGKNGWLLFLDEFTHAAPAVQKASYKLVLDRQIGKYNLHPNCYIVCAGNLISDNALAEEMSTALQSRLIHLELEVNHHDWLDWAYKNNIHHHVTSYITYRPDHLFSFDPDHSDKTFRCPRTWEFLSLLLDKWNVTDKVNTANVNVMAGTIGEGAAREFYSFINLFAKMVNVEDIVRDPVNTKIPEDPTVLYALSGSIGKYATKDNLGQLFTYIKRIEHGEFQAIITSAIKKRYEDLQDHPEYIKWALEYGPKFKIS